MTLINPRVDALSFGSYIDSHQHTNKKGYFSFFVLFTWFGYLLDIDHCMVTSRRR